MSSKKCKIGILTFSDELSIPINESQRLIGRADLGKFTKKDPKKISRSQFTIFRKEDKFYLIDNCTNVQEKPSTNPTFLNDKEITGKTESILDNKSKIRVSDVELEFKIEDMNIVIQK